MTLECYLTAKKERLSLERNTRERCADCRKARATCYCAQIKPFASSPQFVFLIHREEVRRGVATGRMAHQCLKNSLFYEGTDFSHHPAVNALLQDAAKQCVVLYPGAGATDLTRDNASAYFRSVPSGKDLVVFILDGTWAQARRMRRMSRNLNSIPQIAFMPETPSQFLVRRQPMAHCYSTIEAVYTIIEWMGTNPAKEHENLLEVFSFMVNQQIAYEMHFGALRGFKSTRGLRGR